MIPSADGKPHRGIKWRPALTRAESQFLVAIPKAALFVVARQLAAQVTGHHDDVKMQEVYDRLLAEWEAQYCAGNVPQKPPEYLNSVPRVAEVVRR